MYWGPSLQVYEDGKEIKEVVTERDLTFPKLSTKDLPGATHPCTVTHTDTFYVLSRTVVMKLLESMTQSRFLSSWQSNKAWI